MLPGEDALDPGDERVMGDRPVKGLPHERFLLGDLVPLAPALLLGQTSQNVNPSEVIACLQPVHLHATRDHLILMANHPSPLSASRPPVPFVGCNHFRLANEWLIQHQRQVIDWKA